MSSHSGPSLVVTGFSENSPAVLIPPSAPVCGGTDPQNSLIFHSLSWKLNGLVSAVVLSRDVVLKFNYGKNTTTMFP